MTLTFFAERGMGWKVSDTYHDFHELGVLRCRRCHSGKYGKLR